MRRVGGKGCGCTGTGDVRTSPLIGCFACATLFPVLRARLAGRWGCRHARITTGLGWCSSLLRRQRQKRKGGGGRRTVRARYVVRVRLENLSLSLGYMSCHATSKAPGSPQVGVKRQCQ